MDKKYCGALVMVINYDNQMSAAETEHAANVLISLEDDPTNPTDYKSVAIAVNEAKGN
tara:strand:+ start:188 stop:361 length:174 start_codon:yes stop_codon:yes gene_type:complete